MMRWERAAGVAALVLLGPGGLAAQSPRFAVGGAEFRTVSFDSGVGAKRVSQLAVPLGAVLPVSSRLQLDFGTFFASAQLEDQAGAKTTINGLTDLQARAVWELVPDVVVLTVTANLPTGHQTLTEAELAVAGAIASDLVQFPVTNFGSGLSVTSGLALATPVGPWALGVAGSLRYSGEFQPLADTTAKYKPGSEVRLRVGADRLVGQGRLSVGMTYSTFSTDEFGGTGAFRSGKRYIPQVTLSLPLGNKNLVVYAWDLYRGNGEYPSVGARAPKLNTFAAGAQLGLRRGRSVLRPSLEYRRQWAGDTSLTAAGSLFSLGARYQTPLGERFTLQPGLRFDTGSIVTGSGNVGLRGFSASLSLRAEW